MNKQLTNREKIVLTLLGEGVSGRKIRTAMGLSEFDLKEIKKSFIAKLGAKNQIHALYLALTQGLIEV